MDLITEILSDIDKDIKNIKTVEGNKYLRNILEAALVPELKLELPEGDPPYTPRAAPSAQFSGMFWQEAKKIAVFRRKDLHPLRRETLFVQALESVSAKEAEILLAVKDQTLYKLYPNITRGALNEGGYKI